MLVVGWAARDFSLARCRECSSPAQVLGTPDVVHQIKGYDFVSNTLNMDGGYVLAMKDPLIGGFYVALLHRSTMPFATDA
jgi:hypothetical protein